MSVIEMQDIGKVYKMGKVESVVLQDIDLKIEEGDYLSICGPSGSGKSSLLSILGLLSTPSTGEYLLSNKNLKNFKSKQLTELRNRYFGFIFQDFNLSSEMNVEENIGLPLSYRKDLSRKIVVSLSRTYWKKCISINSRTISHVSYPVANSNVLLSRVLWRENLR